MMVIGANTPAMIRSMTREVESRNLIVASMHLCVQSPDICRRLRAVAPRPDSPSHYTVDNMTRNICLLATLVYWQHLSSQKKARPPPSLPRGPLRVFTAARPDFLQCFA